MQSGYYNEITGHLKPETGKQFQRSLTPITVMLISRSQGYINDLEPKQK